MERGLRAALGVATLLAAFLGLAVARAPALPTDAFSLQAVETTEAPDGFALEVVRTAAEPAKRVLIYHTHTYEAYEQVDGAPYAETERWRTADAAHNVRRVGAELAALLRAKGIEVTHDEGTYEPPALSSSYTRSLAMLEARAAAGERYDLYIDLHRDAYAGAGENAVVIGGTSVARLMLLVGKGSGYTDAGYEERPQWNFNLAVAENLTDALNAQTAGLCRDVCLKSGRFNQHVADACVLVEVGNNRNTLDEALAAMPYLADAIALTLDE